MPSPVVNLIANLCPCEALPVRPLSDDDAQAGRDRRREANHHTMRRPAWFARSLADPANLPPPFPKGAKQSGVAGVGKGAGIDGVSA